MKTSTPDEKDSLPSSGAEVESTVLPPATPQEVAEPHRNAGTEPHAEKVSAAQELHDLSVQMGISLADAKKYVRMSKNFSLKEE